MTREEGDGKNRVSYRFLETGKLIVTNDKYVVVVD